MHEFPFHELELHSSAAVVTIFPARSSAIAEGPRDALCQLKSCQLQHNCTISHI